MIPFAIFASLWILMGVIGYGFIFYVIKRAEKMIEDREEGSKEMIPPSYGRVFAYGIFRLLGPFAGSYHRMAVSVLHCVYQKKGSNASKTIPK